MVIADTGFWLALIDRKDSFHEKAVRALKSVQEPLVTTWPVLTETCHLLLSRLGSFAMLRLIQTILRGGIYVFALPEESFSKIHRLMKKYQELPMDLADASLVLLAEHLGHGRILSTDRRDFKTNRWKERRPFTNLMND